ncbi:MAG: S8 family serine peptidase, partial [Lachnospiraceae bacterium]|nr:S8 family serine peptidase [Lachnospiraceae bacterium]
TEEETEDLFPGLPDSYKLSSRQMEDKLNLAEHADEIAALADDEGNTNAYAKGEVVYLADSREEAETVADAFGGELKSFGDGVAVIRLGEKRTVGQAVKAASSRSYNLPAVWPNYYYTLFEEYNDPALQEASEYYQWAHEYVGDMYAWNEGYKGAGVKIGIIDTGVHSTHEDLKDNVKQNLSMVTEGTAVTTDPNGHGTHVAGIAAAVGNNGKGGAGIAPDAQIYAYSVMDSEGYMKDEYILRAINRAVTDGVDVVNMSLGSGYYNGAEDEAINKAYQAGVAVFAAAGNEATNGYEYPASYDKVCSVAALNQDGTKAGFTNYGNKIDLAFPGVDIVSTYNESDQSYASLQGTSMACPVAVGTAAVILSGSDKVSELNGKSGEAKVDALFSVMKKNVNKASSPHVGSGTTYLPKVFGITLKTLDEVPAIPEFDKTVTTYTEEWVDIPVTCSSYGASIYYSINGKKPVFKNGTVTNGQLLEDGKARVGGAKQVTLNVIAVNRMSGKASKVVSQKYKFEPAPSSITITAADSVNQIAKGKNLTLSAVVEPSYAKYSGVEWSVSKGSGVTVNNKGKVTVSSSASGECVIQAKAGDKTAEYSFNVIDTTKITKIVFTTKKYTIYAGDSQSLVGENNSNISIEGGEITDVVWSSNNKKVATVDTNGMVTALAPGKATIKATANDGSKKAGSCTITVKQLANHIELKGPGKIAVGKSAVIRATITPANVTSKKLNWTVEPANNVTVSASGKVSVKSGASGTYTITATEKDVPEGKTAQTASIQFEVVANPITKIELPKTINLFTTSGNYDAPASMQLEPVVSGGDAKAIEYISSAPEVASVDANGLVEAHSSGKATITCSATDGSNKKVKCNVVVSVPMSRIAIVPKNANEGIVSVGSKITLSAKVSNNFGKAANQNVKWSVMPGSEKYITIDEKKGVVKAIASDVSTGRYPQAIVKAEAMDGSGASAIYPLIVTPKVTKFNANRVDVLDFQPYVEYAGGGKAFAPSYSVDISGGKDIGYQNDPNVGAFWLVPKWTTTNRTLAEIIAGGGGLRPNEVRPEEVQKVKVTVTLKDGSNKKQVFNIEYVATKDGEILSVKPIEIKGEKNVYSVNVQ